MKKIIHLASQRGNANHGWLQSFHSFSFANYYNPEKLNYGVLRVLNDDTVSGRMGFGKHPHDNMEIISIPLEGVLEHQDSMGNKTIIKTGEVQIMSAGTGVAHSEKNHSSKEPVKFLQIWIIPKSRNTAPRYEQSIFEKEERQNKFQTIVSPLDIDSSGLKINQNAWFNMIDLEKGKTAEYKMNNPENGVYIFLLDGNANIENEKLHSRDAIGIEGLEIISIIGETNTSLLVMEIPMSI